MSHHVDRMDFKAACDLLDKQLERLTVGDRYPDVHAALEALMTQITATGKAIEIAEQQHRIDRAEADRKHAEQRIAELQS